MSLLVVMGSGETAPPMVPLHRELFEATGAGPALLLDTPFAFQENADQLVARIQAYFARSVGRTVGVARWRRADAPALEREATLARLAQARWVFAGPGSPTYALRQWSGTPLPGALADVVRRGGTLVLGSAAAVTLGSHAVPVYEIYKVGADPRWMEGLDLLGELSGLRAAVVPHYDNAEGGTHDTRYCYLGERRLSALEASLPPEVGVLGVDEHTALVLDLVAGAARVAGRAGVTVRRAGRSRVLQAGAQVALDELGALLRGEAQATAGDAPAAAPPGAPEPEPEPALGLGDLADRAHERFEAALERRDLDGCLEHVLALEEAIDAWRTDMLESEDADRARRALRAMIVRLAELARRGARDPATLAQPYVEVVLELRARARAAGDYATSDLARSRLAALGVEVRDTREHAEWRLAGTPGDPSGGADPDGAGR